MSSTMSARGTQQDFATSAPSQPFTDRLLCRLNEILTTIQNAGATSAELCDRLFGPIPVHNVVVEPLNSSAGVTNDIFSLLSRIEDASTLLHHTCAELSSRI